MTISKVGVLAGTMSLLWICSSIAAQAPAYAADHELANPRADQRAAGQKDQGSQEAKPGKELVEQRSQAEGKAGKESNRQATDRQDTLRAKAAVADDVSDASITTHVKASFMSENALKGADIHVETADRGVVVLSGYVPNNTARVRAISLAWDTKGVKKVDDQLQLKAAP